MTGYFNNPILPGFHPDPSICRVGEDYYMATSSFAYFPGIPLFHSRDLVHWEQIGHVIHRREQLDFDNCQMALGLWAPTLRFHQGRFYLINTFVSEGLHEKRMNYIVTAENPAGPWSDPVVVEGADGIDPSLYFGEDGKMWYVGHSREYVRAVIEKTEVHQVNDLVEAKVTGFVTDHLLRAE